jgi:hypothetical protein
VNKYGSVSVVGNTNFVKKYISGEIGMSRLILVLKYEFVNDAAKRAKSPMGFALHAEALLRKNR